jgi:hypothetical protein
MLPVIAAGAAALGNIAGNAISSYGDYKSEQAKRHASEAGARTGADTIANSWNTTSSGYDNANDLINNYYNNLTSSGSLYNSDALKNANQSYQSLLSGNGTTYTPTDFNYDKTIESFYDPAWQTNNQAQMRSMEGSAANAGHLYSSGLLANQAATASNNATNAYKEAREAYNQDKTNSENVWSQENANLANQANNALNRETNLSNYLGNYSDVLGNYTSSLANNNLAKSSAYQNMANNYASLLAQGGSGATSNLPIY